jgi:hypothetical protein
LILLSLLSLQGQQQVAKNKHLAVALVANAHSQLLTYAIITTRDGKIVGSQTMREEQFMYQAMGHWPSALNQKKENLFEKNGVDSCWLYEDEFGKISGYECIPFQRLWKIRFYEHPISYDTKGWSHGQYKPSNKQMEFLEKEYGIKNIQTEYIYGDSLFKLLRDVMSQSWINRYNNIVEDTGP